MKSYLISSLTFRFANTALDVFTKSHPHDWLLWEPGNWKPPGSTTLVGQGLSGGPPTPTPQTTGEALALALEKKADGSQLTLGRGPECDAVINDGTLSQLHLAFMQNDQGAWTVRDAGSRNGSKVDGLPLAPGKPVELRNGIKLSAAGVTFTFYSPTGMLQRLKL